MSRRLVYMAHPLSAPDAAGIQANIERALRWLAWARRRWPSVAIIAPWIASVLAGDDDADPDTRAAALLDDVTVVERCDKILLVGGRISTGMRLEMGAVSTAQVVDLTALGAEPPSTANDPLGVGAVPEVVL